MELPISPRTNWYYQNWWAQYWQHNTRAQMDFATCSFQDSSNAFQRWTIQDSRCHACLIQVLVTFSYSFGYRKHWAMLFGDEQFQIQDVMLASSKFLWRIVTAMATVNIEQCFSEMNNSIFKMSCLPHPSSCNWYTVFEHKWILQPTLSRAPAMLFRDEQFKIKDVMLASSIFL